ncbi:MAG: NADH-quinone oxidoreductase subunit L [Actinobacteria bacterium]|nr:NADH-quinone oxidoreductase subunit L [Actinomycetota bacterium]
MDLIWLVPALPLFGFLALVVLGRRLGDPGAGWFATAIVGASFVVTAIVFLDLRAQEEHQRVFEQTLFTWIPSGSFEVSIGFLVDPLSILMCLFITGIGALIHLYSIGYMKGDEKFSKFFVYLNLFIASMLLLVLGDNLLLTFLGWEGVGACSYLLISFWHTDPANATAGKKAFVTNRIGDFGFMLGTFLVWVTVGSVNYVEIREAAPLIAAGTATAIALLFFLGAVGKSAQLPLFVWLPDAMAGPTPVSALIHAATMVTAGIYLITRLNPIMAHAGWANDVIAWTGVLTALVAATAAVAQTDIKKVLAYSTVSQLGYMFLAIGTQTYVAGIFHMVTHAFFKALLFLGAGAVIHSMAHEQDMRKYGNLRKYLPITFVTFFIGWLAIAGVPPMSGFWSKDEVLAGSFNSGPAGPVLWGLGLVVAGLTAFYMTRQLIMVFFGKEQWREEAADPALEAAEDADVEDAPAVLASADHGDDHDDHPHDDHHGLTPDYTPHESPWTMLAPLVVLAGLSAIAGLMNLPFSDKFKVLEHWLRPVIVYEHHLPSAPVLWGLASGAVTTAAVGIFLGWTVYSRRRFDAAKIEKPVLANAWYIDDAYAKVIGGPGEAGFQGVADVDANIVDGAVNGVAAGTAGLGEKLRGVQTGFVRSYAVGISIGAAALLAFIVTRMNL